MSASGARALTIGFRNGRVFVVKPAAVQSGKHKEIVLHLRDGVAHGQDNPESMGYSLGFGSDNVQRQQQKSAGLLGPKKRRCILLFFVVERADKKRPQGKG